MENSPLKILLDSNVLISAFLFGGKPEEILQLVLRKAIQAYISPQIETEITKTLVDKFNLPEYRLHLFEKKIRKNFTIVYPRDSVKIVRDEKDNKIIDAAVEGECGYIITGDKDLLELKEFRKTKIVTPVMFLEILKQ